MIASEQFKPQPMRVRPHRLETPQSYLRRLCAANVIDERVVAGEIKRRTKHLGTRSVQLATAIRQLGGPDPEYFVRSYQSIKDFSSNNPNEMITEIFGSQRTVSYACTRCSGGEIVETYTHRRFCVCLKHRRWLAPGGRPEDQRQVPDGPSWIAAERSYRRIAASPFLTTSLIDGMWLIVRDQAQLLGPADWGGRLSAAQASADFTSGVDDRLALYPETVRVTRPLATAALWEAVNVGAQVPEFLNADLRRRFWWIGYPDWALVEALTHSLLKTRREGVQARDALVWHDYQTNGPFRRPHWGL